MWIPHTKVGVINGYDLARTDGEERTHSGNPRLERTNTVTVLFLNLGLLACPDVVLTYTHGCDIAIASNGLQIGLPIYFSVGPGNAVHKGLTADPERSLEIRHV